MDNTKKCPYCGEEILAAAKKCKHCGEWFDKTANEDLKVNSSVKLENLYELARRAKKDNNPEKTIQYYEQVLMDDPNSWEAVFYSAFYSSIQNYRNDNISTAIGLLENCIYSAFSLFGTSIQETAEQKQYVEEVAENVADLSGVYLKELNEHYDEFRKAYFKAETSEHNNKVWDEYKDIYNARLIAVSKVYSLLGVKILFMFGDGCEFGEKAKSISEEAISIIEKYGGHIKKQDRKKIIDEYRAFMNTAIAAATTRRHNEYWDNNQSLKTKLESEKQSLNEQIAKLNTDIKAVPGYTEMVDSQKQLDEEKSSALSLIIKPKTGWLIFGIIVGIIGAFFTFGISLVLTIICSVIRYKKMKPYRTQQADVESEFKQKTQSLNEKYSRVISDIEAIKKDIASCESRIGEIDTELTKPR